MAKVIEPAFKFKPIKCKICGCTYEFEKGDHIEVDCVAVDYGNKNYVIRRTLVCPVCGNENNLEIEGENKND